MRATGTLLLLPLVACSGSDDGSIYETGYQSDFPACSRVRGTEGVVLYQDDGTTVRSPAEEPNAETITSGVAGPLDTDGLVYVAATGARVILSTNAGCDWDTAGYLPDGDWALRVAGGRIYAFDRRSAAAASSEDQGASWSVLDASEPFVGVPVVDPSDAQRLRGVQARGVVSSVDGGATWTVDGTIPDTIGTLVSADVSAGDLSSVAVGGSDGVAVSTDGGVTWSTLDVEGTVASVALHPESSASMFYIAPDSAGLLTVWRSEAAGSPDRLAEASQIEFDATMRLYPLPGDPTAAVAGYGPVPNNDGIDSLALYTFRQGEGARTLRLTTFFHMHQLTFGPDRWLAAVDAVPEAR
jgi:hypothetical protein